VAGHPPLSAYLLPALAVPTTFLPHAFQSMFDNGMVGGWTPPSLRLCAANLATLAALPFLLPVLVSLLASLARSMARKARRRALLASHTRLESIRAMPWQDFERLCGKVYRRRGFAVEENGLGGADGGVDLVLSLGWTGFCKRWRSTRVGVREVRESCTALWPVPGRGGACWSLVRYTAEAAAFAKGKPLDLFVSKEEWTARRCLRCCWKLGVKCGYRPIPDSHNL
jgi:restriction system protein